MIGAQTILNVLFKLFENGRLERKQVKFKLLFLVTIVFLKHNGNDSLLLLNCQSRGDDLKQLLFHFKLRVLIVLIRVLIIRIRLVLT